MDNISKVIHREKARAVFPIVCADHCAWLAHTDFEETVTDPVRLARAVEKAYRRYDYDMALIFTDAYVEAQAMGCPVRLSPYPTLTGPRSVRTDDRTDVIVEAARILASTLSVPVFVSIKGPFSLASFLAGMKDFLIMVLKDTDRAQALIEEALEHQILYLGRLLNVGAHIFIGDPVASASVVSPDIFVRYAQGPLQTLVRKIQSENSIAGIHICGDTVSIIKQLDSIRADILSIENVNVSTESVKMGGVSTSTIRYGSKLDISREIEASGKEPHLILSTSCDVPVDTPPENIHHMVGSRYDPGNH